MKISTKGLYAVRLMLYLAEHDGGGPVSLKEVSESLGISKKYLEQIVSNVVTAKLVRSVRGAAGGYQLAKPPDQISVGHIIDAMEGPLNLSECATEGECECPRSEGCKTRRVWEYLTDSINRLLYSITLQDMLESKEMNES